MYTYIAKCICRYMHTQMHVFVNDVDFSRSPGRLFQILGRMRAELECFFTTNNYFFRG